MVIRTPPPLRCILLQRKKLSSDQLAKIELSNPVSFSHVSVGEKIDAEQECTSDDRAKDLGRMLLILVYKKEGYPNFCWDSAEALTNKWLCTRLKKAGVNSFERHDL